MRTFSLIALVALFHPAIAFGQADLSQADAQQLLLSSLPKCLLLPIGLIHLNLQTEGLTREIGNLQRLGVITVQEMNRSTGNAIQDAFNIAKDPMSAVVRTDVAPGVDRSEICVQNGKQGVRFGASSIKEVVFFKKLTRNTIAGQEPFYVMRGIINHTPTELEQRLHPEVRGQTEMKFQSAYVYDEFKKTWAQRVLQAVPLNQKFDPADFNRQLQ